MTALEIPGVQPGSFANSLDENFTRYAFLTIEDRAIPDARDGLKPSQRRLLVAMNDLGLKPNGSPKKCAKIAGDTSGNYHPHGEQVVYPTLVRMAQPWVMRSPLIKGQGNFGNRDGDAPAAMRYTEATLSATARLMLDELSPDVVDFVPNYNDERQEPTILPARYPQLLVNGANGIAVGYATRMTPHNLGEVIDVVKAYLENENITVDEIMAIMPGPDFPTGGKVVGRSGIREYYSTGRGSVKIEGDWQVIEGTGRQKTRIIITELPYMCGPSDFLKEVVELVKAEELKGISDARDLSSKKNGLCVELELSKEGSPELILAILRKKTSLRKTFSINQTVMMGKDLKENLTIRELVSMFVDFRELCITRKLEAERKANIERTEIVDGLISVQANLDEAIKIIRASNDPKEAQDRLIESKIIATERQASAVLSMTLRSLTKLEEGKLRDEKASLKARFDWLNNVIGNSVETRKLIVEELDEIKAKHADERRTRIIADTGDIDEEDMIEDARVVISLSGEGYAKSVPIEDFRLQKRGGSGSRASNKKHEDGPVEIFEGWTKDRLFFFTNRGRVFQRKAYQIPSASKLSRGIHVSNLLELMEDETVTNMVSMKEIPTDGFLVMITKNGFIKRSNISEYDTNRKNAGINAISLEEGDEVAYVLPTTGSNDIFIVTQQGNAIRYSEEIVRVQGRNTRGSRAMKLNEGDRVAQIFTLDPSETPDIFVITTAGFGKKSASDEFRRLGSRNVKGYAVIKKDALAKRGGSIAGACALKKGESLLALTRMGQSIRFSEGDIRNTGRATAGVRVVRLSDGDSVVKLAKLAPEDEETD